VKAKITYQRGNEVVTLEGTLAGETVDYVRLIHDHHDTIVSKAFLIDLTRETDSPDLSALGSAR